LRHGCNRLAHGTAITTHHVDEDVQYAMTKEIGHRAIHRAMTPPHRPVIVIRQMIDDVELSQDCPTKVLPNEWGIDVLETSDRFILIQAFGKILDRISVLANEIYQEALPGPWVKLLTG